jgi:hypothetical protein
METFLAVLLGIGCFAVGPFMIALVIIGVTLTFGRAFHRKENPLVVKEAEQVLVNRVTEPIKETAKDKITIG